ncbi:MAG TPA: hypothetical protein VEK33_21555 [Terriglobales bacterium]|nr:hypothetical protein [Terriglobales bacterium]
MTAHLDTRAITAPPAARNIQTRSLIVGVVFSGIAVVGWFLRPDEFFRGYLLAFMAWLGVTLGSMAILMIRHLTGGGWGMVIRRVLGAAMRSIPLMTILFVPILFGLPRLYPWARSLDAIPDPHLRQHLEELTKSYLSTHGVILRAVIYFAIWNLLSFLLTRWSREQDRPNPRDNSSRFRAVSGPGLILYAFTISFAAIDWVMSIDPSWISTIYGLILLIGELLSGMCFAVVVERILVKYQPMAEWLKADYVHDHGNWMLTFIMVWAYFCFSQLLIIWAGNLPDEITWYFRRFHGGWSAVGIALIFFHFVVPFVILLSRSFKRDIKKLVWLAVWLLLMRWVDLVWIIEPNFSPTLTLNWAEIIVPVAMGGWWMWFYFRNLTAMPLLPMYDPEAREVLEPAHE